MKKWLLLIACCGAFACFAISDGPADRPAETPANAPADRPTPPPSPKKEKERRVSFVIWRVFSNLPDDERKKMMELQRTDPEKFRSIMTEKGKALIKADRERQNELRKLAAEYQSSSDTARKRELYKKIEESVRQNYFKRIEENRRHLAEMKRRTQDFEAELNKREKNADPAIKTRIEAILRGDVEPDRFPPPPPPPHR